MKLDHCIYFRSKGARFSTSVRFYRVFNVRIRLRLLILFKHFDHIHDFHNLLQTNPAELKGSTDNIVSLKTASAS